MFGALWTNKEIEKKMTKDKISLKESNIVKDNKTINDSSKFEDSIAHKRVIFFINIKNLLLLFFSYQWIQF